MSEKTKLYVLDENGNFEEVFETEHNCEDITFLTKDDFIPCEKANRVFADVDRVDMNSTSGEILVQWLWDSYNNRELETGAREYQREKVAKLKWKQGILETILTRDYSGIPEIHIRVKVEEGLVSFEIIDGQQRSRAAIIGFLKGEFKLPDNFMVGSQDCSKFNVDDLRKKAPNLYKELMNYKIKNTWYENLSDEITSELFVEVLNNTNGMKAQEIRNAVRGFLSKHIRDNSRFETHDLFNRKIKNLNKSNEKQLLEYFPNFNLNGRMEVDEFYSQLIYGLFKGYQSGVSNDALTNWIKDTQRSGGKFSDKGVWNKEKKIIEEFTDFCLGLVSFVRGNDKERMTKNVAYLMFLYGWELKTKYGKLDKEVYVKKFWEIYREWSDTSKQKYIGHFDARDENKPANEKRELGQFKLLFGGLNSIIKSQVYVLDYELNLDEESFGVLEIDSRETFSSTDIDNKLIEQKDTCYYTGEPLSRKDAAGDHFIPRNWGINRGGVTEYKNLVVTSSKLNNMKSNKSPLEFLKELEKIGLPITQEFRMRAGFIISKDFILNV